jgi:putative chitinase
MKLTLNILFEIAPYAKNSSYDLQELCDYINDKFEIRRNFFRDLSTINRQAAFISQCAYESSHFKRFTENLNYSARGLLATFPKYFNAETAAAYQRKPERIANRVYANRMGNGPESTGDGWKYRGRGMIQLTGRHNYLMCGRAIEVDLVQNPTYLETIKGSVDSAYWFWTNRPNLNVFADQANIKEVTRIINGGTKSYPEREKLFKVAVKALSE